jgi:actin-like ATPase involved in cell morphogenesis
LKKELHRPGKIRRGDERESVERIKIATTLFNHIHDHCAAESGRDQALRCVITVPSGFHELQREALKQVAQASGFKDITLVDEARGRAGSVFAVVACNRVTTTGVGGVTLEVHPEIASAFFPSVSRGSC